ncbi:MAG: uroporphyrinogen-III synthase [Flavobacteriaceae bacterium]|nr:uroporphyrinogen-III synthase [Flavobacteriaceae bacterium]
MKGRGSNPFIVSTKKLPKSIHHLFTEAEIRLQDSDFLRFNYLQPKLPDAPQHIVISSQNALKAIVKIDANYFEEKTCFCVGLQTRKTLEKYGAKVVADAPDAESLVQIIDKMYLDRKFTFFSGNLRRDVLPEYLRKKGVLNAEIVVYETLPQPIKMSPQPDGILFFSPSGVKSYLLKNTLGNSVCFCIGQTTAAELKTLTRSIQVAASPSVENVAKTCIDYFKNP